MQSTWLNANESRSTSGRTLVVIQLDGGNDGLNTIVPFRDEGYARNRRQLRLPDAELIKVSDEMALHPRLRGISQLLDQCRLTIAHGVGYPNPNRSHFESMRIWQAAAMDKNKYDLSIGWLGGALGDSSDSFNKSHAFYIGDDELPIALRGRRCHAVSLANEADLRLQSRALPQISEKLARVDSLHDYVTQSVAQAYASTESMRHMTDDSSVRYPNGQLAQRLKLVSQLMKSDSLAKVYYTSQSGYDTHASQLPRHAELLSELSSALKAFMEDMRQSGFEDRILVLCFSEFGRRVAENDSLGTDHGTAGPVILAGSKLRTRNIGSLPSLTELVDGDLRHQLDFRAIYAAIVREWLELPVPELFQSHYLQGLFV